MDPTMRTRPAARLLSLCLLLLAPGAASASQKPGDTQERTETYYVAEVVNGDGAGVKDLGRFPTRDEAEAACQAWNKQNPRDLRITRTRKIGVKVRDVPPTDKPSKAEEPRLGGLKGKPPEAKPKGRITVKVYKLENNKWAEQAARKYESPDKYDSAVDYYQRVKGTPGWAATWNAPGWPKPPEPIKPTEAYKPPSPAVPEWMTIITGRWYNQINNDFVIFDGNGNYTYYSRNGQPENSGTMAKRRGDAEWYDDASYILKFRIINKDLLSDGPMDLRRTPMR
jgi:hypothetical protein